MPAGGRSERVARLLPFVLCFLCALLVVHWLLGTVASAGWPLPPCAGAGRKAVSKRDAGRTGGQQGPAEMMSKFYSGPDAELMDDGVACMGACGMGCCVVMGCCVCG